MCDIHVRMCVCACVEVIQELLAREAIATCEGLLDGPISTTGLMMGARWYTSSCVCVCVCMCVCLTL